MNTVNEQVKLPIKILYDFASNMIYICMITASEI